MRVLQHPSAPLPPLPLGAPARAVGVLAYLRAGDAAELLDGLTANKFNVPPIVLTDWSARIARDWRHLDARWDNLSGAITRVYAGLPDSAVNETRGRFAALLSELTELTAVQLPDWRQALRVHAEAELALYDMESGAGR